MCMSDRCQLLDIHNVRIGISKRFHMDGSGVFLNGILYLFIIKRIYKGCFDAVFRKRMRQQVIGSSINILCGNDMFPCMCQILKRICDGCCTGRNCQCCHTAFQCCNSFLKNILCRIGQTAINISGITQIKSCCCMITVTEYIGRSLIDRNRSCVCHRIRLLLSYMKL